MALSKRRKIVRELDVVVADSLGSVLDAQLSGGGGGGSGGGGTESTGVGFEGSNGNSIASADDDARGRNTRLAIIQCPMRGIPSSGMAGPSGSAASIRVKPSCGRLEIHCDQQLGSAPSLGEKEEGAPETIYIGPDSLAPVSVANNYRSNRRLVLRSPGLSLAEPEIPQCICSVSADGKSLALIPADATVQLRPCFDHVDAADQEAKAEEEGEKEKKLLLQQQQQQQQLQSAEAEHGNAASNSGADGVAVPLHVRIRKQETEKQQEIRLHSYAHIRQMEDQEPWTVMIHERQGGAFSKAAILSLRACGVGTDDRSDADPLPVLDGEEYLHSACFIGNAHVEDTE